MKGVSGKVLTVVITLIVAMFALLVIWEIYRGTIFGRVADTISNLADEFASSICEKIPMLKYLC